VYAAFDKQLQREVAIKILQRCSDKEATLRFQQEAKALCALEHPNIVHVYSFGLLENRVPYLVMEHVSGRTLTAAIKDGSLASEQIRIIMGDICKALRFSHAKGIIHRDLKPDNILIGDDGTARLVDFGICYLQEQKDTDYFRLTQEGQTVGTALYMSPEQAHGRTLDGRSDIYSLGCILYECLTGKPPFMGESAAEIMAKQDKAAPDLSPLRDSVQPLVAHLGHVAARALEKKPAKRFQNPSEMMDALMSTTFLHRKILSHTHLITLIAVLSAMIGLTPFVAGNVFKNRIPVIKLQSGVAETLHGDGSSPESTLKTRPPEPGSEVKQFVSYSSDQALDNTNKGRRYDEMSVQLDRLVKDRNYSKAQSLAVEMTKTSWRRLDQFIPILNALHDEGNISLLQKYLEEDEQLLHSQNIHRNDGQFAYLRFILEYRHKKIEWGAHSPAWGNAWRTACENNDLYGAQCLLQWWQWYLRQNNDPDICESKMAEIRHDVLCARLRPFVTANLALCKWRHGDFASAAHLARKARNELRVIGFPYLTGKADYSALTTSLVIAWCLDCLENGDSATLQSISTEYGGQAAQNLPVILALLTRSSGVSGPDDCQAVEDLIADSVHDYKWIVPSEKVNRLLSDRSHVAAKPKKLVSHVDTQLRARVAADAAAEVDLRCKIAAFYLDKRVCSKARSHATVGRALLVQTEKYWTDKAFWKKDYARMTLIIADSYRLGYELTQGIEKCSEPERKRISALFEEAIENARSLGGADPDSALWQLHYAVWLAVCGKNDEAMKLATNTIAKAERASICVISNERHVLYA
jgi:serine/threonine protein kinase